MSAIVRETKKGHFTIECVSCGKPLTIVNAQGMFCADLCGYDPEAGDPRAAFDEEFARGGPAAAIASLLKGGK